MALLDSILQSVKLYCLVPEETTIYDSQIVTFINSALNTVKELGVGPLNGYHITDGGSTWGDLDVSEPLCSSIEEYVKLVTRLAFDPPTNSFLVNLLNDRKNELEWRITNDYSCVEGGS